MSEVLEGIIEHYSEETSLKADGFDDAIMGMCIQFGGEPLVAYNYEKCNFLFS